MQDVIGRGYVKYKQTAVVMRAHGPPAPCGTGGLQGVEGISCCEDMIACIMAYSFDFWSRSLSFRW